MHEAQVIPFDPDTDIDPDSSRHDSAIGW